MGWSQDCKGQRDNVDSMGVWILGHTSGIPRRFFCRADDITKERAWDGDHQMHSPIFDYY